MAVRAQQIVNEIYARSHFWDSYDQGRLAHANGQERASNPWDDAFSRTHVNCGDWYRGFDAEANRYAEAA